MNWPVNSACMALPHPASGKNLADIEASVSGSSLLEFERRGVTDDDLVKVKAQIEATACLACKACRAKSVSWPIAKPFLATAGFDGR